MDNSGLKPSPSPMETTMMNRGGNSYGHEVKMAKKRNWSSSEFLLRLLALVTTMIAAIVMGVSNETTTVHVVVLPNLPPLNVEATAKWQHLSASKYFMVANIIACVYSAVSLALSIVVSKWGSKILGQVLFVHDLIMVGLLSSAIGAAGAVGLLGYKGNPYTGWKEVCSVFGRFCRHNAASVTMSLIATLMFMLILLLAISRLPKRSAT